MKIHPVGAELFRATRRTDGPKSIFSFLRKRLKPFFIPTTSTS